MVYLPAIHLLASNSLLLPDEEYILTDNMAGSFAEIPKSLAAQIEVLTEQLTVSTEKLKEITDHFVKELEKGT